MSEIIMTYLFTDYKQLISLTGLKKISRGKKMLRELTGICAAGAPCSLNNRREKPFGDFPGRRSFFRVKVYYQPFSQSVIDIRPSLLL